MAGYRYGVRGALPDRARHAHRRISIFLKRVKRSARLWAVRQAGFAFRRLPIVAGEPPPLDSAICDAIPEMRNSLISLYWCEFEAFVYIKN
ncbi:hypothetical protein [Burkholderia ubonensis]|uniref:hypothetical protein n=1 Tax=Burkholderia ubonensis TaxID=101571 RepID=UPI001055E362|nr:hypothetical protein [Burkholderia ubonensis]